MAIFRVARVGTVGLNVRSSPGLSTEVIGSLDEGTDVEGEDETTRADDLNWRRIVEPVTGFVADKFLDSADGPGPSPTGDYVFPSKAGRGGRSRCTGAAIRVRRTSLRREALGLSLCAAARWSASAPKRPISSAATTC